VKGLIELKIQFLSLDSNVWPHNLSQTTLIDRFKQKGFELSRVFCKGFLMGSCIPLSELEQTGDLTKREMGKLCEACIDRSLLVTKKTQVKSIYLDDYVDSELLSDYMGQAKNIDEENWFNFVIDDVSVGKIAAYEFYLKHKLSDLVIPSSLLLEYKRSLLSTLKVMSSARNAISETNPDVVISYNASYSLNNAYSQSAARTGVSTYSIQGGAHIVERGKTLSMYRSTKDLLAVPFGEDWQKIKNKVPSTLDAQKSLDHFTGLVSGKSPWAYSSKAESKNPKQKLGILDDNYTILALTSSEDEVFAAKLIDLLPENSLPDAFPSQSSFIQAVYEVAVARPNWNFIIRLHPRLLPNKRDNKTAVGLRKLNEILGKKPINVYVNYPSDEISIYDLYAHVDVGLNYRSSAGYEMMACGIPVITCISKDYLPGPIDGMKYGRSVGEIIDLLESAEESGPNLENAVIAYRWWGFLFNECARLVTANFPTSVSRYRPTKSMQLIKVWRFMVKVVQLNLPMLRENIDLKRLDSTHVDDRFIEVIKNRAAGVSACKSDHQRNEDTGFYECKRVMREIRLLIGLPPI
jgi:hypothetical protein